jgi:hypothetical protein
MKLVQRIRALGSTYGLSSWCLFAVLSTHAVPVSAVVRTVPESYSTIQAAIDASAAGDTVLIGPGTYRGVGNRDIELQGRSIVVRSRSGPEATIIDCENAGRGFYLRELETREARIEGLSIVNGYAAVGAPGSSSGGGIFCAPSSPTISDCRISNCRANNGGGLNLGLFHGVMEGTTVSGNYANNLGGGVYFGNASFQEAEFNNCVITGNESDRGGGVCFAGSGPNRLTACTVTSNSSERDGGGIWASLPLVLERCIVWGNCSSTGVDEIRCGDADISCSDVDTTAVFSLGTVVYDANCISVDPMFCEPFPCGQHTQGDWALDVLSSCLADHSPCEEQIGALGLGCGATIPTGACCFSNGSCLVLEPAACADQNGIYMGDGTTCDSTPCQPTPVQPTTWGRIKASYR